MCSGDSERQVKAIADHIGQMLARRREFPLSIEGLPGSNWVLMDFADVVVHVFKTDVRDYYALEKLWADAGRVHIPQTDEPPASVAVGATRKRSPRLREHG